MPAIAGTALSGFNLQQQKKIITAQEAMTALHGKT
jgi:hypothetical protein